MSRRLQTLLGAVVLFNVPNTALAMAGKRGPASAETIVLALVLALLFAIAGRLLLNRLCALFLGGIGGILGATSCHNIEGAAVGLLTGLIVAIAPPYRQRAANCSADI